MRSRSISVGMRAIACTAILAACLVPLKRQVYASAAQQDLSCPYILPDTPVSVAPGQPAIGSIDAATPDSMGVRTATPTAGIINAICDVNLSFVGCGFLPTSIVINCDSSGDGVPDLNIPLININPISAHLVIGTLSTSKSGLPGTAFPLACCGGIASVTLSVSVSGGDDNIYGPFTETKTCPIDVGRRAPVVVSASPSTGECGSPQNLIISGSCFILPDGTTNVTSVYAVDQADSTNVIQSSNFTVLGPNLVDALFDLGPRNAGKTFLIYVAGVTGVSRNLTSLPQGVSAGCPLGNEQGVQVTFGCNPAPAAPPSQAAIVSSCSLTRAPNGKMSLTINGSNIQPGAQVMIGGQPAKKLKFTNMDSASGTYTVVTVKGGVCGMVPATIIISNPGQQASAAFQCTARCGS